MNLQNLKGEILDTVFNQLEILDKYNINSSLRVAHFLGQVSHESGGFEHNVENLNYSAQALIGIFPSHFADLADANNYARNPEKIANRIYANRMGNGDEASGDGWLYRGRGYIQITGKENQTTFLDTVGGGIPSDISDKYSLESACWFWNSRKLNFVADCGAADSVVMQITKMINGGNIGLQDRILLFNKYLNLIANAD